MKRIVAVILTAIMLLSLAACGQEKAAEQTPAPTAVLTPEPTPEQLATEYVEILKSGCWQYSYIVPYEDIEMTTTEAAKDGASAYRVALGEASSRIVKKDGRYFVVDDKSGQMAETTAEKNLGGELDFSGMALTGSEERDGKVFESYSMLRNGLEQEFTFVFESGKLIGLHFSYVDDAAPYFETTEFKGEADAALFELPDYDAMFEEAMAFYDAKEYDKSFPLLQTLSNAKYAAAMTYLGQSYYYGDGVEENEEAALIWYKAAVDAGDAYGQACLGDCYCFGDCGVEIDYAKALELYRLSADAGNAYGMYCLGWMYEHGMGTEQDYTLAREWCEKAAALGNASAINEVGYLYDWGLGVSEDDAEAVRWYARAAETGHRIGLYNMGPHTYYGQGGPTQDKEKAREYWEQSAAKGYQPAIDKLLEFYGITYTPESGSGDLSVENASIDLEFSWGSGTIVYTGAVDENGLPHGQGVGVAETEDEHWSYTGAWEHGHFRGQGELTSYSDNYVQSGEFKDDALNGYGSQTQDGVLRYEGQWSEGDLHGQGKLYTKAGELLFEGEFERGMLVTTQEEREKRTVPFIGCDEMDTAFYASWKDGYDVLSYPLYVKGSVAGMSEQNVTGSVIIYMNGDSDYPVALTYRYSVDEPKITAEAGTISAFGYCVGTYEYSMGGVAATCPHIEIVRWTTG